MNLNIERETKMKKVKIILTLVLISLIMTTTGCKKKITEGEVYKKEYQPETTTMMPIINTVYVGETPIITTTYIPITNDESWVVDIRNKEEGDKKYRKRRLHVSKDFYQKTKIGNKIVITENDILIVEDKDGL